MRHQRKVQTYYSVFFILAFLESIVASGYLLSIPSDEKAALIFGFSAERLALLGIVVFFGLLSVFGFFSIIRSKFFLFNFINNLYENPKKIDDVFMLTLFASFLSGFYLLLPREKPGRFLAHQIRLDPVLIYICLFSLQFILCLILDPRNSSVRQLKETIYKKSKALKIIICKKSKTLKLTILIFACLLLIWLLVAISGIGIRNSEVFWGSGGVPILPLHILLVGGMIFFGSWFLNRTIPDAINKYFPSRKIDLLFTMLLLVSAAVLWNLTPMESNYFVQGPYNFGDDYLPYSDASHFDIGGHFALIGQGLDNNNPYVDHSAYMAFLAFLHKIVGYDFQSLVFLQVIIFSIYVGFAYWVVVELHSRVAGLFLACLLILRQAIAIIAGKFIFGSHVKLLMTEIPIAIGLSILTLMLVKALKHKRLLFWYALPAGSITALMILTRYNTLVFPLVIIAALLVLPGHNLKNKFRFITVFISSLIISLTPWMWRTWRITGNPFSFFEKSKAVFGGTFRTGWIQLGGRIFKSTAFLGLLAAPIIKQARGILGFWPAESEKLTGVADLVFRTCNHFFHSLILSVVSLPIFHYPVYTLTELIHEAYPFWDKLGGRWQGEITLPITVGIIINLFILSVGLGKSWKRRGSVGLVPLYMFLVYHASTAIARISGGRILVPCDWLLIIYYVIGLVELFRFMAEWLKGPIDTEQRHTMPLFPGKLTSLFLFFPMFAFLLGMVILDQAVPQTYTKITYEEIVSHQEIFTQRFESSLDDPLELHEFLNEKGGMTVNGLLLYPRFYDAYQIISSFLLGGNLTTFPRLEFYIVGPSGVHRIIFPIDEIPQSLTQGQEVIAIGCPLDHNSILLTRILIIKDESVNVISSPYSADEQLMGCRANDLNEE